MNQVITSTQAFQRLSEDDLRLLIPSAYSENNAGRVKDCYQRIPTPDVLKHAAAVGWIPTKAYQVRPKKEENKGFQKHFIHLRNPNVFVGTSEDEIELIPEMILVNSYDGRASFKLTIGIHRVVCSNGLVIHSRNLSDTCIKHKSSDQQDSYKRDNIRQLIIDMTKHVQTSLKMISKMKKITLNPSQQRALAQECCRARWDYKYVLPNPSSLLKPIREEDNDSSAWIVFNRIQEKFMNGGWIGAGDRKVKPLVDPNRAFKVNRQLFLVVEDFLTTIK